VPKAFFLIQRPERGNRWYVAYYGPNGKGSWLSTGTTDKGEAEKWAQAHNPANTPHIDKRGFALFAAGWFEPDHEWVKRQEARGHRLSPNYLDTCRGILTKHILPKWKRNCSASLKALCQCQVVLLQNSDEGINH